MHIPDETRATQLLESLDTERKSFTYALAARLGALSPAQLSDLKSLRQAFTLELQARFVPDVAARISYTSEDLIIPLALAIVRIKADQDAVRQRNETIKKFLAIFGITLAVLFAGYLLWVYVLFPQQAASPVPATTSSPPSQPSSGSSSR